MQNGRETMSLITESCQSRDEAEFTNAFVFLLYRNVLLSLVRLLNFKTYRHALLLA